MTSTMWSHLVSVVVAAALVNGHAPTWPKYFRSPVKVYYKFYGEPMDWQSAQERCKKDGSHLAIVDDDVPKKLNQKRHYIMRKLEEDAWIGLRNGKWVDGKNMRHSNYMPGSSSGECVFAQHGKGGSRSDDGKWRGENCAAKKCFVCESDSFCVVKNKCKNGGQCQGVGDRQTKCVCPDGFTGDDCGNDNRPCIATKPCLNGAQCVPQGTSYHCKCKAGFQGVNCEHDARPCIAYNPCLNKGQCLRNGVGFTCKCMDGFKGNKCEKDVRPCIAFNPCKNGANCVPNRLTYTCKCLPGFKGKDCEKKCVSVSKGGLPEKLDLVFVVDGSRSVKPGPFKKCLEFIDKIVERVDVSPSKARVGFIEFSNKVNEVDVIDFKKSEDLGKAGLKSEISHTHYHDGGTLISKGLNRAIKMFQEEGRKNDASVEKYMVLLSDGASYESDVKAMSLAVTTLKNLRIKTFVVAVGDEAKTERARTQLKMVAMGKSSHVFEVDNYDTLNNEVLSKVIVSQCD